ncbi:MAG: hypothetical protein NTY68_01120, partial [Candidatus Micrarchaeota archaeon]|nr:hypothetical protein [Candidatus Micrarchaeota archaeon]
MGRISRNLCIFLLLLLVVPTVYAEPKTEIRMEILPVSSADDTGDLSISANFTVLFTNSTTYTKPDGSTQIVPAEQRSLNNAKVYFSISDLGSSRYIPLGGGQAYAADTQVDAKMSDGTTETLYYGFHTIFGIDSNYSGKCALVKAEFKGESDDPDPNIGNAVAVQEVCFGTQSMPSMLTFLITNELMNPENSPLCIPFLLLIIFAGGAFYFRGGSMVHLLDFAQPRLPKLHEVRFKYGGYGWHGSFGDATKAAVGDLNNLKKSIKGLKPAQKAELDELLKFLKKDTTGLAGILASGKLAGMSMDDLKKLKDLAKMKGTDQAY